jgi:hypothetical protein
MKKYIFLFVTTFIFIFATKNTLKAQEKFGPTPTKQQLAWHEKEFYLFMHFGPNTFTDLEWGKGSEDPNVFNPTQLDCNQWAGIAKASGAKGIIITAKHHDGFSLWPSKFSKHTVRESKWMDGKGDVIKMLSEACKKAGIEMQEVKTRLRYLPNCLFTPTKKHDMHTVESEQCPDLGLLFSDAFPPYISNLQGEDEKLKDAFSL